VEYTVVLIPQSEEEGGGYLVRVPALDAVTQGASVDEALDMARDLIETLTAAMRENGDPLPAATTHTVTV
jgi:predicted RNase H-like HicB family nuclease